MPEERFVLVRRGDGWFVNYRGMPIGPFTERTMALRSAILSAERAGAEGADAEVVAALPDQRPFTLWKYGRDGLST